MGLIDQGQRHYRFWNGNVNIDPNNLNAGFLNSGNTNSSGLTFGSGSGEGIASQAQVWATIWLGLLHCLRPTDAIYQNGKVS